MKQVVFNFRSFLTNLMNAMNLGLEGYCLKPALSSHMPQTSLPSPLHVET